MTNGSPARPRTSGVFSGLLLIVFGFLVLLHNYGHLQLGGLIRHWWPLIFIFWGATKLYERTLAQRQGLRGFRSRPDHQRPSRHIDDKRQRCYPGCMECEEADNNPEKPDYKMPSPIRVGSTMSDRAHNAKYPINQHPSSKK